MSLVEVSKSIRIDNHALDTIEAVRSLLDDICEELENIVREDDHYCELLESGYKASAYVQTFLDAYAERDR